MKNLTGLNSGVFDYIPEAELSEDKVDNSSALDERAILEMNQKALDVVIKRRWVASEYRSNRALDSLNNDRQRFIKRRIAGLETHLNLVGKAAIDQLSELNLRLFNIDFAIHEAESRLVKIQEERQLIDSLTTVNIRSEGGILTGVLNKIGHLKSTATDTIRDTAESAGFRPKDGWEEQKLQKTLDKLKSMRSNTQDKINKINSNSAYSEFSKKREDTVNFLVDKTGKKSAEILEIVDAYFDGDGELFKLIDGLDIADIAKVRLKDSFKRMNRARGANMSYIAAQRRKKAQESSLENAKKLNSNLESFKKRFKKGHVYILKINDDVVSSEVSEITPAYIEFKNGYKIDFATKTIGKYKKTSLTQLKVNDYKVFTDQERVAQLDKLEGVENLEQWVTEQNRGKIGSQDEFYGAFIEKKIDDDKYVVFVKTSKGIFVDIADYATISLAKDKGVYCKKKDDNSTKYSEAA
jgi:hypothetical protein